MSFSKEELMKFFTVLLFIFLVSCGQKKEAADNSLTKVQLQLNWMPEAEHGGYYEAFLKGFYQEEGLDLEIISGGPGVKVETEVAIGRVEFGIANADKILMVRDKGMKLKALMSPFEKSPRCLIFHKELGVKSFKDLTKAKVMSVNNTKPYYHWLMYKFPSLTKVDAIPYNKAIFLANKESIIQGYINSEPLIFKGKGLDVDVLKLSDTGFNPYASVLICSESFSNEKADLVAKVKRASIKGWKSYLKDATATNMYIEKINPQNKGTLNQSTKAML